MREAPRFAEASSMAGSITSRRAITIRTTKGRQNTVMAMNHHRIRLVEPERGAEEEDRDSNHHPRQHLGQDHERREGRPPPIAPADERERARDPERKGQHGHPRRDVEGDERGVDELVVVQEGLVPAEGEALRRKADVALLGERNPDDDEAGADEEHEREARERVEDSAREPLPGGAGKAPRPCARAPAHVSRASVQRVATRPAQVMRSTNTKQLPRRRLARTAPLVQSRMTTTNS